MNHRGHLCFFLVLAVICLGINVHCRQCGGRGFSQSGKCHPCPRHCTSCKSTVFCLSCAYGWRGDICQKCQDGFYKEMDACHKCPGGCTACTDESSCTRCTTNMWKTMGYCSRECKSSAICSKGCKDGYFMAHGNYCLPCLNECATCTSLTPCDTCITGRWGVSCGLNCFSGCSQCAGSGINQCTKCKDGYTLLEYKCNAIQSPVECPSCIAPTKGTRCRDGSLLSGHTCQQCPAGCAICSSLSNCTSCSTGYYKPGLACKGDQLCIPVYGICDNGCTDGWKGIKCEQQCGDNCNVCDQLNGTCIQCKDGKYGENCDQTCSKNCKVSHGDVGETTCNTNTGSCNYGCVGNFTGLTCDKGTSQTDQQDDTVTDMLGGLAGGSVFLLVIAGVIVACIVLGTRKQSRLNVHAALPKSNTAVVYYSTTIDLKDAGTQEAPLQALHTAIEIDVVTRLPTRGPTLDIDDELVDAEFDDGSDEILIDDSIYYTNVAGLKRSRIQLENLHEYVTKKTKDDLSEEFQKLPQGLTRPYHFALKTGNRDKNRYRGIYPYDVTRVKLIGGASDFINSNYIDGYNTPKAYIASQGPTRKTMDDFVDFWRMVWQEKVDKIVMLTHLIEDTKMKCEQYWPNAGTSHMYGEVMVTCQSEDTYAEHTLKEFTISMCSETRSLHHFHFTAWPEKGVPDDVISLIEFRQKVESSRAELGGPVIVHCSAGVARTGTYIALEILIKEGNAEKSVDIFGCVVGLRSQRVAMVQTEEQYIYLHNSVVHALTFDCQAIQCGTFQQYMSNNTKTIYRQYQLIQSTDASKSARESEASSLDTTHPDRNRKGDGGQYRPPLYIDRKPGATDYNNATFVNSYQSKSRYIVVQTPLPSTLVDFLTLVFQENCPCIVSMDEGLSTGKAVVVYLPAANQTLTYGTFQISCSSVDTTSQYKLRKLTIKHQGVNWPEVKPVNHFQFTCWTRKMNVPNDPSQLLKLINDVEKASVAFVDMGPILIHCLTGAERSGLFCAVAVLIQKMAIEHEVSVVNTVRQMQSKIRGSVPNKEQYMYCHQCVSAYLQISNFLQHV